VEILEQKEYAIGLTVSTSTPPPRGKWWVGERFSITHIQRFIPLLSKSTLQMAPGKEETFQLFCCIYEATMIDKDTASKPLKFEMNIGMHYHFLYFCNFFFCWFFFQL